MNTVGLKALVPLLLALLASPVLADLKTDPREKLEMAPREKLETAIHEGIRLLEAKEYVKFIQQFAHPDDLKQITKIGAVEDLAKDFAKERGTVVLTVLRSIKDKKPVLSNDGNTATYKLEKLEGFPRDEIIFVKAGKFWYIKN